MSEISYAISGMTCEHCVAAVTREVSGVPGVRSVEVSLEAGVMVVRGDDLPDQQVRAAVDEAGYTVA
jgi:copper chaperone